MQAERNVKNEPVNETGKLDDLSVAEERAEGAKGGGINYTKIEFNNTPMKEER